MAIAITFTVYLAREHRTAILSWARRIRSEFNARVLPLVRSQGPRGAAHCLRARRRRGAGRAARIAACRRIDRITWRARLSMRR